MVRALLVLLLLPCSLLFAEDSPSKIEELERKNAELENRLRVIESAVLEEEIEAYLEESQVAASSQDAASNLPGGMAWRLSGELRIRGEARINLYAPGDPNGDNSLYFVHMRTRLRFDIEVRENIDVRIVFQDLRNWGEELSTIGVIKGVDLQQGVMILKDLFGEPLVLEAGRFTMKYGNERIIGALDWFDQGRSYDGLRFRYDDEGGWIDFFAVKTREIFAPIEEDQQFLGVYGGFPVAEQTTLEGYLIWLTDDMAMMGELVAGDTDFITVGARAERNGGSYTATVEGAFQSGEVKGDDLTAWALVFNFVYRFDAEGKPRLVFEVAYATGNEAQGDGKTEQFQVLFPTNHMHYGYADFVAWSNILDIRVGGAVSPRENWTITLDFHYFELADSNGAWVNAGGAVIRPGQAGASTMLGYEIDFQVIWKPNPSLSFLFGWAVFLPGDFIAETGQDPTSQFLYLQGRVLF